ncbi:serine/threonine protein kinase [Variovorax sp. LT2P21]|uniref:serine/threonine protein kinase n=1 Tax=Variovorax sp. LT2P21 TaxID=3443731 RepID=UPI003F494FB5
MTALATDGLPNDERTVRIAPPAGAVPLPAAPAPAARPGASVHALPDGATLGSFRIERSIGEGGFGIVYLAWDAALERHVAIKEYMPYALASREGETLDVSLRTENDRPVFDAGLKSFVNEARLLARFDHPALVKVFSFWEANRTAYMAMPYYEGPTLKAALAALKRPASEQELRAWIAPLLEALTVLHGEQCYHRDISPDNVLLTAGGPLLLDFGAARRVISDRTQALTAMLKPGFAPIEQYGGTMLQGPWTDLYALAGVVRYAITGRPPVASVARVVDDAQRPLAQTHAGRYSEGFLRAIDTALAVRPEDRPQDVTAFRALLAVGQPSDDEGDDDGDGFARTQRIARDEAAPTAVGAPTAHDDHHFYATTLRAPMALPPRRRALAPMLGVIALASAAAAMWWAWPAASVKPTAAQPDAAPTARAAPAADSAAPAPTQNPPMLAPSAPVIAPPVAVDTAPSRPAAVAKSAPLGPSTERALPHPSAAKSVQPRTTRSEQEVTSSYTQAARPPKCGELVLKASLEALAPDEMAFLKSRCR